MCVQYVLRDSVRRVRPEATLDATHACVRMYLGRARPSYNTRHKECRKICLAHSTIRTRQSDFEDTTYPSQAGAARAGRCVYTIVSLERHIRIIYRWRYESHEDHKIHPRKKELPNL